MIDAPNFALKIARYFFTVSFLIVAFFNVSEGADTYRKIPDAVHDIKDVPTWKDGARWCFEKYKNAKKSGKTKEAKKYANYVLDILRDGMFMPQKKPITYGIRTFKSATDAEFDEMMIALSVPAWELASDAIHEKAIDITKETTPILWRVKELLSLGKKQEAIHFLVAQTLYWTLSDVFIDNQKPGASLVGIKFFQKLMERLSEYKENFPEMDVPSKKEILHIFYQWWRKMERPIKGIPRVYMIMKSFESAFGKLIGVKLKDKSASFEAIRDVHSIEKLSTWQNALTWCIDKYDDAKESDNKTKAKKYANYILDIIERGAFTPNKTRIQYDIQIINATDGEFSLIIKALSIPAWELASDFIHGKPVDVARETTPIRRFVLNLAAGEKGQATNLIVVRSLYWMLTDVFITNQKKGSAPVCINFFDTLMNQVEKYQSQYPKIVFPSKNEITQIVMQWWGKMKNRTNKIPSAYHLMKDLEIDYGRLSGDVVSGLK